MPTADQSPEEIELEQQAILDVLLTEKTTVSTPTSLGTKTGKRKCENNEEDIGKRAFDLLLEAADTNLVHDLDIAEKFTPISGEGGKPPWANLANQLQQRKYT